MYGSRTCLAPRAYGRSSLAHIERSRRTSWRPPWCRCNEVSCGRLQTTWRCCSTRQPDYGAARERRQYTSYLKETTGITSDRQAFHRCERRDNIKTKAQCESEVKEYRALPDIRVLDPAGRPYEVQYHCHPEAVDPREPKEKRKLIPIGRPHEDDPREQRRHDDHNSADGHRAL